MSDQPDTTIHMPIQMPREACPGPCNRKARDVWNAYDQAYDLYEDQATVWEKAPPARRAERPEPPAIPDVKVIYGDPVWSGRCADMIRRALAELDDLASLLTAVSDGHRGLPSRDQLPAATIRSKPGSCSPSPIQDTLDELFGALVKMEDEWRTVRRYSPRPRRARDSHARRISIMWLLDELDAILCHPASLAFGKATLAWQRRLRTLTKSEPVGSLSPIRCPRCSEVQVRREDDGYYKCHTCGRLLNQAEFDREKGEQEQAQEAAELEAAS